MAIYIDSAMIEPVRRAFDLGWVTGITTNPTIFAEPKRDPKELLEDLSTLTLDCLYYQLTAPSVEKMIQEAYLAKEIVGEPFFAKIPPTPEGFKVCSILSKEMHTCLTAIFTVSQALIANECGADTIAVYVNRGTREIGDGIKMIGDIVKALEGRKTQVLAASLKSVEEVDKTILTGAQYLTLPPKTLFELANHPSSEKAVQNFRDTGLGLSP